jgi:hypothetical protein
MTPKEKAKELVEKFYDTNSHPNSVEVRVKTAKQCALIAVDEIDNAIDFDWMEVQNLDRQHAYWDSVKKEIQNL